MKHGLNLQQIKAMVKRHYLNALHPEGTPEADMVSLINEIMRLRGILSRSNLKMEMLRGAKAKVEL